MKVLHVIPSISRIRGGPSFAIDSMTRHLVRLGMTVDVATTNDDGEDVRRDVPLGQPIERQGVTIRYFERQSRFYTYSRPLTHWLEQRVRDYDLLHIHALFSHTSTCAGLIARRAGVPYIVRPLGVLNRWGMQNRRRLLKRLSFSIFEKRVLDGAALIHYTSEMEKREAEEAGVRGHALVLPLGIDLSPFGNLPRRDEVEQGQPELRGRFVFLFLSRIDQKKGLDLLLPALAQVRQRHPEAILLIAGAGEEGFTSTLRAQAASLGVVDDVVWMGFLQGQAKLEAFGAADAFVLPSYSENFGIAAAEAMVVGLPVIVSDQVGFAPEVERAQAGIVVPCAVDALASAMSRLIMDAELGQHLGQAAQRLASEQFSVEAMAHNLAARYAAVCEGTASS